MSIISVIVPVFNGEQYIESLIGQIESAYKDLIRHKRNEKIELLFINDNPNKKIECKNSELISIRIFNTTVNRGIHGARVIGLNYSRGEYILFLDQDDKICTSYFTSQLNNIKEYSASVCRAIHEEKAFYNKMHPFESMLTKEFVLNRGNPIVSPGQVLLRKSRIPEIWEKNIIKHNGADDFFLWLCMIVTPKAFALNQDILFEHVVNYSNTSSNSKLMYDSVKEVISVIKECDIFSEQEKLMLDNMLDNFLALQFKNLDKYKKMYYIFNEWMNLKNQKKDITNYIIQKGYNKVALYGLNQIARMLIGEIKESSVDFYGVIDINADYINEKFSVRMPNEILKDIDLIIVMLVEEEDKIREQLNSMGYGKVITIRSLLEEMSRKDFK